MAWVVGYDANIVDIISMATNVIICFVVCYNFIKDWQNKEKQS